MTKTKRKMSTFQIAEISAVDVPAQEGAKMVLVKRGDEVDKAKTKTEGGQSFPASDYAYVPDPEKPSTWKLRLTSTPGGSPDSGIVGAAAAALGPGFRGNRVQIPSADRAAVVARVRRAWRSANPDKEDSEMPSGIKKSDLGESIAKRYLNPMDGAVSFATALGEELKDEAYHEVMEKVHPYIYALECALKSIAGDSNVPSETKLTMMRNSIEDFMTVIRKMWSEADTVMSSVMSKLMEGEDKMAVKTVKQYESELTDLQKQLEEAVAAKGSGGEEDIAALKAQVEELTKSVIDLTAERDEAVSKAAMTDQEKEYMNSLGKEEAKAFAAMNSTDRQRQMKKSSDDDEVIKVDGRVVRKSAVGEDMFAIIKSQEERNLKIEKQAADDRAARQKAEFEKRADDSFSHLPGTVVEKGAVLKAVSDLPEEVRKNLDRMLEAGEKAIKSAFSTIGNRGADVDKAAEADARKFADRVTSIQKAQNTNRTTAISKARREDPAGFKAFRESGLSS